MGASVALPGACWLTASLRNHAGFYQAFGTRPGDTAWVDPKDRLSMW